MYKHEGLTKDEIIMYLRKSRSDDALLTVEEVLQKHESILNDWSEKTLMVRSRKETDTEKLCPVKLSRTDRKLKRFYNE